MSPPASGSLKRSQEEVNALAEQRRRVRAMILGDGEAPSPRVAPTSTFMIAPLSPVSKTQPSAGSVSEISLRTQEDIDQAAEQRKRNRARLFDNDADEGFGEAPSSFRSNGY